MERFFLHWVSHYGYFGISFLLMLGIVGIPVPDETLLALTGFLVFKHKLEMAPALAAAFGGSIFGITFSYLIGRSGGYYLVHTYGHKVGITPEKLEHAHRWMERTGKWGLSIGYFVPGVRHLTALGAGAARMKYPIFALFAYTGAAVWSTTFILVGFYFGKEWTGSSASIHRWFLIGCGALAVLLLIYYAVVRMRRRRKE
ncbi:MAG: DedA family protein [Syntrophobacteraceae bacterium]